MGIRMSLWCAALEEKVRGIRRAEKDVIHFPLVLSGFRINHHVNSEGRRYIAGIKCYYW